MPVPSGQFELFLKPPISRWIVKSAAYTAEAADKIIADTTSASWLLTLPAAPVAGDSIFVIGFALETNYLDISFNGNNFKSALPTNPVGYEVSGQEIEFVYVNSTVGWICTPNAIASANP